MVVVPRAQQRPAQAVVVTPRPDTITVITNSALASLQLARADSALQAARANIVAEERRKEAARLAALAADTMPGSSAASRDSIERRIRALEAMVERAQQAPLLQSYRALAELPELRADTRVLALIDSLGEIEREREGFGAVGGVDPIFVALTARASEIGRGILAVAGERRDALRNELQALQPVAPQVAAAPVADTLTPIAARDSARAALAQWEAELVRRRGVSRQLDLEEERARERANAVAPPLALLAAAFVLSAVFGFAMAFFRELRRPHVSSAAELERYLDVRVLSTVETPMPSAERGRRNADRAAPPYFDPGAEGYQLAYLSLATDHPAVLTVTVTGDDMAVAALVACNMAAVAAHEARNTLVLDFTADCSASAALRARVAPGLAQIAANEVTWPDATVSAQVGRDRSVDLVPHGVGTISPSDAVMLLQRDAERVSRYYDAAFAVASSDVVQAGLPTALASSELVYCAQPGVTPLPALRAELDKLREGGSVIRGIILWNAERPMLPTPRELAAMVRGKRGRARPEAMASA